MEYNQKNDVSFSKGISYCVGVSLLLTLILVTTNFIFMFFQRTSFLEVFSIHLSSLLFFGIIIGLISLLCAVIIGIPTVLMLRKLKQESFYSSSLIGALIALLISTIIFRGWLDIQLVVMFYGSVCGYAFMHGYKKENRK